MTGKENPEETEYGNGREHSWDLILLSKLRRIIPGSLKFFNFFLHMKENYAKLLKVH